MVARHTEPGCSEPIRRTKAAQTYPGFHVLLSGVGGYVPAPLRSLNA